MDSRNLYLTNIPVEEALERFLQALSPTLGKKTEMVEVASSLDRVTAEAVFARANSPLYDSAAMDGIAVVSKRTHGASESAPLTLKDEDYMAVDTGDPVTPPFDAVIMAEDVQEAQDAQGVGGNGEADSSSGGSGVNSGGVVIRAAAAPWQHVRPVGEDIVQGEMILPGGHKIRPIDVGAMLAGGITNISVFKLPEVAIIPTGSELVEPGSEIKQGDIIESNSRMFEGLVRQGGGIPFRYKIIADDYEQIKDTVREAALRYDMVLISAGTSAGREDYTVGTLRELGDVVVHGVAMKPGKPVVLAVVGGKPVIGLPGYPVSAYLAFDNFAVPVLKALSGHLEAQAPVIRATLARRLVSSLKHREYVRVKVGKVGDRFVASPLARGAGAAMSLVRADGFCIVGQDCEGVEAGDEVDVLLARSAEDLDRTVVCIGSHDLILDLIADMMPNLFPGTHLSTTHVGSMGGLMALKNGETHIAPIHLMDEDSGEYNVGIINKLFPQQKMALIKGVGRTQGIMVKSGNPLGIKGLKDLPGHRYINRQRGAGTRVFFDYKLKADGIDPSNIDGYEREAATHMAVAAAISSGSADAGMGILSAANAMDLDFIKIGVEEYDFAVPAEYLETDLIRSFIETLKHPELHKKLEELGGYDLLHCGEIAVVP